MARACNKCIHSAAKKKILPKKKRKLEIKLRAAAIATNSTTSAAAGTSSELVDYNTILFKNSKRETKILSHKKQRN